MALTPDLLGGADLSVSIREAPGKGFGAFATRPIGAHTTVGDYTGELLSAARHKARYGGEREGWSDEDEAWLASRRARGVSATGDYVVRVHDDLFVDAEDPARATTA